MFLVSYLIMTVWMSYNTLLTEGFGIIPHSNGGLLVVKKSTSSTSSTKLEMAKFTNSQRKKYGMNEEDDEYDLDMALDQNTDPIITKIIAGSFIVAVLALLVAGVIIPSLTDYGEGVCSPIQNGGRC